MKDLRGKKVLVYGMGTSGQAACKLLHKHGACVSFYDEENRFGNYFAFDPSPHPSRYELLVVSPGIKVLGNKLIAQFQIDNKPILSELDLAFGYCKGHIIGITGTNGKTTVTSLVGKIIKDFKENTYICGNIGLPFSSVCEEGDKNSYFIVEVSNFQLELSSIFMPEIACILNLAPDHIDRHGSYEEYMRVKKKIISSKAKQRLVLNYDDQELRKLQPTKRTLYFSKTPLVCGVFEKNNGIFQNKNKIISCSDIPLFGEKNLENVMAAVAIASLVKIKPTAIRQSIINFKAPKHRLEFLGSVNGANVFDDSKATNLASVITAVESLSGQRLVLLLGGRNKAIDFDELFRRGYSFESLLIFGEAGEEIYDQALKHGYQPYIFKTMKAAALYAKTHAEEGQVILLSPGCASFDEFSSYAARGEVFKELMLSSYDQIEN